MIDIHTHLLPGVDDGCNSLKESLSLLRQAEKDGIDSIIITTHYDKESIYHKEGSLLLPLFDELRKAAKDIKVKLYLGNEIYISRTTLEDLKEGKALTLAGGRYILAEFPFTFYEDESDGILYDLKQSGYQIIIAHPERYAYVKEDPYFTDRWLNEGYLLQANTTSLRHHKKTMEVLLKERRISFMASDAHNEKRPPLLKEAYEEISFDYGKEYADDLFINNPKKIIG